MPKKKTTTKPTENKPIAPQGHIVLDEKAGDYFYNEQTGQPEPIALADNPATPADDREKQIDQGKVADPGESAVDSPAKILLSTRAERLPGETRNACWERLRKMARAAGLPRGQGPGTAYFWADEQIARIFAQPEFVPNWDEQPTESVPKIAVAPAPPADDQGVSGLSDLPAHWPELPANAQLQVEIAWVTANRLRVRSGTGVDLGRALSPAPSYSALSWLETSILFPAKFADISVKATADNDNEREEIRREKLAIEEIRSILGEMLEAGDV